MEGFHSFILFVLGVGAAFLIYFVWRHVKNDLAGPGKVIPMHSPSNVAQQA